MIVLPTFKIKILLSSMFIIFHSGLILTIITINGNFNSITDPKIGIPFVAISFLMIAIGLPFGVIGWKYLIVRLTGKGEWVWSQKDLDRQNIGDVKQ